MHTQNVNVNGATEASRICEKTTPRFDGYIKNVDSVNEHDVILADALLTRLEAEAHIGSGLHDELYENNLHFSAWEYMDRLPLLDRITFFGAAQRRGILLTRENMGMNDMAAYCFDDGSMDDCDPLECPF
ncbi:hypothetical protein [Serratia sp. 14-2641]|uniref:hypothetical protein n=1 Tax=Serratia sp. 14-2641 TaxID=1841657 RepID=UPI00080F7CBF|nr:hypothetical protein [Serratia sp. 14-2641]OCJ37387.1 hypothetical protein A6U95_25085 [Serratia sp. 14-2641]